MFKLEIVDGVEIRLAIQVILVILTLLAFQMVGREYKRNRTTFMKFLSLSFAVLFAQAAFMLTVFSYGAFTGKSLPEIFMPMIDHLLKVIGFLLLAFAFTSVSKVDKALADTFYKKNIVALFLVTPAVWFYWYKYLSVAPLANQKFGYFWGDLFYETWTTLLLFYGLYLVLRSRVEMKKAFTIGLFFFIAKQLIHMANLIWSNNTLPAMLVVERISPVLFFYIFIMAVYHEIIGEIMEANEEKERLNKEMCSNTLQALIGALELKDCYTKGHAKRVTDYSLLIGERLGLSLGQLNDLHLGAMLHDIGKIGVHENILNKEGSLKEQQLVPVRRHPIDGAAIIEGLEKLSHIAPTIKFHHEWWDGSGYPEGLNGENIPLLARIVAVADAFDAMTSDRAYRRARTIDEALKELQQGSGIQFDPLVVRTFIDILQERHDFTNTREAAATLLV